MLVQARVNFELKGMLCFFRRVRNSAAKDIFFVVGCLILDVAEDDGEQRKGGRDPSPAVAGSG